MYMRLWLEFLPDMAVLHVLDGTERTEVRGHPGVGTIYEGGRLDRMLDCLRDNNLNVSVLFAEDVLHVRSGSGAPIRAMLKTEMEMTQSLETALSWMGTKSPVCDEYVFPPNFKRNVKRYREGVYI